MKSRYVSFFVEPKLLPDVKSAMDGTLLPRFSGLPSFMGFVALHSDVGRLSEIVALSFWDDDLEGSEEVSLELREGVERLTGTAPTRKSFDILRAIMRNTNGEVCFDSP